MNIIWGVFQHETHIVEQPKNNKPDKVKLKCLKGYDAIREQLDEGNTLTVGNPVGETEDLKQKKHWLKLD